MRITFITEQKIKITLKEFKKMDSADIMADERDFKLYINNQLFYHDEYFPMWEFCRCCYSWLKKRKGAFIYNTVETEENPHILFTLQEGKWKLYSVWQKFECEELFTLEEVQNFINEIIDQVIQR